MHVHGSGGVHADLPDDDPQRVDLDALAAGEKEDARANVA
jgi:hypothetical protein